MMIRTLLRKSLLAWACTFSCGLPVQGQHLSSNQKSLTTKGSNSYKYKEFEQKYELKLDSLICLYADWKYEKEDTLSNPYYALLFSSPTLYSSILKRSMIPSEELRKAQTETSEHIYGITSMTDSMLVSTYALHPWLVRNEEASEGTLAADERVIIRPDVSLSETLSRKEKDDEIEGLHPDDDWQVVVRRPNFWTFKTRFKLQFTQNYVSDNWYKGGESHNALLAETTIQANFNNQQKLTFENTLEMRLGFQTSHNDEEHKYKTNSDLLRLTNKLGLRAFNHWYYTVMLQSWTQFYKGYRANDKRVYSDFMSPLESVLSVGMDYKLNKKKFTLNATLSPIALKLKYVNRPSLETSFGLNAGHHTKWDYGSNITINYNWKMFNSLNWQGRIYYFTDYSKTQVEWENTFRFTINKYLSSSIFLYPRFDDSRKRKDGESYFQFNELLSLGLEVNF